MSPSNYQVGRNFEYATRDRVLGLGAAYCMRAAQSKGLVDLIVLWDTLDGIPVQPWVIQAKKTGRLSKKEREDLIALGERTGVRPYMSKQGARGEGVLLIPLDGVE